MTPDPDLIGRLVLRVEADAHRGGWDAPAALYVLYDTTDPDTDATYRDVMAPRRGAPVRCHPYAGQSAVPESAFHGNPAHALFRFALNTRGDHPMADLVLGTIRRPGFLGLAFLYEGWMRTAKTKEERDALGAVRFADIPGSVELRSIMAADIAGNDYLVMRERGQKPELHRGDDDDLNEMSGAIIESLRSIVAKVAGLPLPDLDTIPSQWDWDAERTGAP